MKVKTSDLIGPALDWAVAKCEWFTDWGNWEGAIMEPYSTEWNYGGPIIERERIDLQAKINAGSDYDEWLATIGVGSKQRRRYGPTPLIAAMRCYVASKLGTEVDVPKELL